MTRTRPLPYLFLMSGTRETSRSTGEFPRLSFRLVWPDNEQRLCHRASRSTNDRLARALYCFLVRRKRFREGPVHEHRNPSGRSDIADAPPADAGPAARPGDVCRRGGRSTDHRPGFEAAPEDVAFLISADLFACGLATLVQCIGFPGGRHSAPGDDGRHLCLGRPDAIDG